MNLASWIILAIVVVIVGLAIKATFFKKKSKGGCCDTGDVVGNGACCGSKTRSATVDDEFGIDVPAACDGSDYQVKLASGACGSCTACKDSAVSRNAVQPIVRPVIKGLDQSAE